VNNNIENENKSKSKTTKKKSKTRNKLLELELHKEKVNHLRKINKIYVNGTDINDPFESFNDLKLDESILKNIEKSGFQSPTPIQMQTIPLMIDRREIIGCAPTGSGKTLAFLLPILHQLKRPQKLGFRAIILAPTRELAKQIHRECLWISEGTGLRVHIIKNVNLAQKKFGPNSALKYDILVTTPNRLVWLLKQEPKAININKYLKISFFCFCFFLIFILFICCLALNGL
jgi:ATP-dependent RNA helicase DDX52/ROK1